MRLHRLELECGHIVKVKIESKKKFGRKEFCCLKCGLSRKRVKEKWDLGWLKLVRQQPKSQMTLGTPLAPSIASSKKAIQTSILKSSQSREWSSEFIGRKFRRKWIGGSILN